MAIGNAMDAAMISRFLLALSLSLLPLAAIAAGPVLTPAEPATAPTASAPAVGNSRWVLLSNIHLEDVLYPAAIQGGASPVATILGTSGSTLRSGHNVITTLIRLDNPEPRAAGVRPSDYVRCYEYFTPNFSQDGTRCFVLQPRK